VPVLNKGLFIKHRADQTGCVTTVVLEMWDSCRSGDCSYLGSASQRVYLTQLTLDCRATGEGEAGTNCGGTAVWKGAQMSGMGPGCPEGSPAVRKRAWLSGRWPGCPEWGPAVRNGARLSGMGPGCPERGPAARNGAGSPEGGPAVRKGARNPNVLLKLCLCLTLYHHDLCIYKLTLSDQVQFTLHWTVSRCDLV
jgi:hypothetical protein